MTDREKLVKQAISHFWYGISHDIFSEPVTTYAMLAIEALEKEKGSGVTVQGCCHKAESVISKTGLMCTACYSDIDRDAVFCKYCGAKVIPQPPKEGE